MYEDPGGGGADEAEKPCLSEARLIPTEITFVGVLYACSHCGMVDEGFNYFRMMKEETQELHQWLDIIPNGSDLMNLVGMDPRTPEVQRSDAVAGMSE
ncbi:hypothetical protein ACFX1T_022867 [Malus domestica]